MLRTMPLRVAQHQHTVQPARNPYFWRLQALLHCAMLAVYRDE